MPCQFESRRTELCDNLRNLYTSTKSSDVSLGCAWYPAAQRIIREWSDHYELPVTTVACVISALSPQCSWERNLIIANDILARRPPSIGGALHACIRKAEILRDEHDTSNGTLAYLSTFYRMRRVFPCGPKVANFAENLAGNMHEYVTVDTHGCQAALNNPLATVTLKWTPYRIFADCYTAVACEVGYSPAEFQAIIWYTWKRLYPRIWKQQHRRQWYVVGEY